MKTIDFIFEEIPLLAGPGRPIALISGTAVIQYSSVIDDFAYGRQRRRGWEWNIEGVTISPPLLGYPEVPIRWGPLDSLWHMVEISITTACGDQIYDEITEANQPDPDARREAMLDRV